MPDDVVTLSYTSGTTGDPKGVKLTHRMLLVTSQSCNMRFSSGSYPLGESDTYISYLTGAHSYEQCMFATTLIYGVRVGCFGGDVLKLVEDIGVLKPTIFPSVPRLLNRIYGKIKEKLDSAEGIKKCLISKALGDKLYNLQTKGETTHKFYDALVFNKVKAFLGGRVRFIATGSAPISGSVLDFLKVCFCCPIAEAYGLTETCGGSFSTLPCDPETGHVGGPVACVKYKLRDIPEMNYLSTDNPPRGEVCIKGPGVTPGYFMNQ